MQNTNWTILFRLSVIALSLVGLLAVNNAFAASSEEETKSVCSIKRKKNKSLKVKVNYKEILDLKRKLKKLADSIMVTAEEYDNQTQVQFWDHELKQAAEKLLHSEGYFEPIITTQIDNPKDKHFEIILFVQSGPRYVINKINFVNNVKSNVNLAEIVQKKYSKKPIINFAIGDYAIAKNVIKSQKKILEQIDKDHCLLRANVEHEAVVNYGAKKVEINYEISAGPSAYINDIKFYGLENVKPEYVRKILPIKDGDCFQRRKITKSREKLQASGLFISTAPKIGKDVDKNGKVLVEFDLKERKSRTLKVGGEWSTDLGFGVSLGNEFRNLFGSAEVFDLKLLLSQEEKSFNAEYRQPFFFNKNLSFRTAFNLEKIETDAYKNRELGFTVSFFKKLSDIVKYSSGFRGQINRITDNNAISSDYTLLSIPQKLIFDLRDNKLNPKKGIYAEFGFEPFLDIKNNNNHFNKYAITLQTYCSAGELNNNVLAMRTKFGTIRSDNDSILDVPLTERFYSGGGNSIRGYPYQSAGPLDFEFAPIGGKSLIEFSFEWRYDISDRWGSVVFYDIGGAYDEPPKNFSKELFQAVGFGIRFYTDFGPFRADIAFPLRSKRDKSDKKFQFYAGIGQNF